MPWPLTMPPKRIALCQFRSYTAKNLDWRKRVSKLIGDAAMFYILMVAAVVHALFMAAELFPWRVPVLLKMASKNLPPDAAFNDQQRNLVSMIVHNAAIYNGIVRRRSGLCRVHRESGQ